MRLTLTVVLALLALSALPAYGADDDPAALELRSRAPLTVRGDNFAERERVRLTLSSAGLARPVTLQTRAGRDGSFRARFRNVRLGRCAGFTVRAVGARGSRAVLQVMKGCPQGDRPA